jgi:hypothetical protein
MISFRLNLINYLKCDGGFKIAITIMKVQYTTTCDLLVIELECKFSNYELMNVFGVVYSQYWLQPFCESTIVTHMNLIKPWATFNNILNLQTSLFKLTMKTQTPKVMEEPRDDNLVIKLWHQLVTNNLLVVHFLNS